MNSILLIKSSFVINVSINRDNNWASTAKIIYTNPHSNASNKLQLKMVRTIPMIQSKKHSISILSKFLSRLNLCLNILSPIAEIIKMMFPIKNGM
jgi:hypothetical protein